MTGWKATYDALSEQDKISPLEPARLVELATSAYLIGKEDEGLAALMRAHQGFMHAGQLGRAGGIAARIASILLNTGDTAQSAGWMGRAARLLDQSGDAGVERGYLLLPIARQSIMSGQVADAEAQFAEASRNPTWCSTVASVWSIGRKSPRSRGSGPRPSTRRCWRASACLNRPVNPHLVRRCTRSPNFTGYAEPKQLAAAGVQRVPKVTGLRNRLAQTEDGRVPDVANVIWCTGFGNGMSWIDLAIFEASGEPRHQSGVVPDQPGLYFVGLHFLHSLSSTMIHGLARDAKRIADIIERRTRSAEVKSATHDRGWVRATS